MDDWLIDYRNGQGSRSRLLTVVCGRSVRVPGASVVFSVWLCVGGRPPAGPRWSRRRHQGQSEDQVTQKTRFHADDADDDDADSSPVKERTVEVVAAAAAGANFLIGKRDHL